MVITVVFNRFNKALLLCVFFLVQLVSFAQNKVSGRVVDSLTREPLPFVNVFFANTFFGSSTDINGEFSFSGFPSGKYDLTLTYVGYNVKQQPMAFYGDTKIVANHFLVQESKILKEILIKPDTIGWKQNFEIFKNNFLGISKYALDCEIKNPKAIFLYYDNQDDVLVAHAKEPILIENRATGYKIKYLLYQFEYNSRLGTYLIHGLPQFLEMDSKSNREQNRWVRIREEIYAGSINHFMRSWKNNEWVKNGYRVSRMYRIPNRERPPDDFLNAKISALQKQGINTEIRKVIDWKRNNKPLVINGDSLDYYLQLKSMPKEMDSVVDESLTGNEFMIYGEDGLMNYKGLLKIQYRAWEDPAYTKVVGRKYRIRQESILHILKPIRVFENGYYEDIRSVFFEEYWSWSEKIATLMPLEFIPGE